jgi:hypothetical protein
MGVSASKEMYTFCIRNSVHGNTDSVRANVIRELDATHEAPAEKQMLLNVKMFRNTTR